MPVPDPLQTAAPAAVTTAGGDARRGAPPAWDIPADEPDDDGLVPL